MMFRSINKQPGIQKFWNWCGHCQDIYNWIHVSLMNNRQTLLYSNTAVYGGKWVHVYIYGKTIFYFHFFEALKGAFEVQIF